MTKLVLRSLKFYWRSHLGVLLGTVLAAAVLTGSLLVGDSVDGSLRKFALQRLGGIHFAMQTPNRFFAADLAKRISPDAAAALQLRGMAIADTKQINQVQVIGCDSNLWKFAGLSFELLENETALNQKLATALDVRVGDEISLRIEKPGLLPGDAPLAAQKEDRTVRARFTVKRILNDNELGRFSLSANQVVPYNGFVNLQTLEDRTELTGKANLLLTGIGNSNPIPSKVWDFSDFGFRFRRQGGQVQLESDAVYLEPEAARAALSIPGAEGTLTYLVNSIATDQKSTPYSFVLARAESGLRDDEIILNRWLADELNAKPGDSVSMNYFELLPSNQFVAHDRTFTVRQIVEMNELEPERELAPPFPGLTDVDRCADWDVGIPMDEVQLNDPANEAYWNRYKQTPKAIVSLAAGQSMWSNRFGSLTSVRWNVGQASCLSAENQNGTCADRQDACPTLVFKKEFNPAAAGYVFQPVREQALAAVNHAMDFGQLFVGMSFFLIVAALMLTGLLFVFGIQQRAEEMGILLATGWKPSAVRRLFLLEGGVIALAGSLIGAWLGTGYTRLLIFGLATYWQGAVANSAIQYFAKPGTVITGAVAGFICALLSMGIAMWRQTKHSARELLMADFSQEFQSLEQGDPARQSRNQIKHQGTKGTKLSVLCVLERSGCLKTCTKNAKVTDRSTNSVSHTMTLSIIGTIAAAGIVVYALTGDVQSVTMPFFGAGALLLVSGVMLCGLALRRAGGQASQPRIFGMALHNVARRRGRSLTVIGLLSCGCFLVFAVSSMKEDVTAHADQPGSGTGGFRWFGESTLPITENPGGVRLRVRDGDDASCLNLNRAQSPRLLGVDPDAMSARKAFLKGEDVWQLLKLDLPDGVVPALVGDADTAMWGLEAKTGVEQGDLFDYRDEAGNTFKVKLAGRLPMRLSVFQGCLLIAENRFVEKFPGEGYRMFLLSSEFRVPSFELGVSSSGMSDAMRKFEKAGLDVVPSTQRLMEFYAVESTYLAMFLVLGALGLVVGSMGMGVVVLRNVQDRRAEIALLRAVGYRNGVLQKLLFIEHGLLLAAGLGVGAAASAVAMIPALVISKSQMSPVFLIGLLLAVAGCGVVCMISAIRISLRGDALRGLRNE